jgi:two-component system chemotaxis family response regulator WspR
MLDVDAFKAYNDTYGHVAGDEVLRRVAAVLRDNCARPTDLPARFGGEEFSMILPSTSPGGARLLAEKVRRSIEALGIAHSGAATGGRLTVSIGAAVLVPEDGQPGNQLVELADSGLYEAKRNGRNQVVVAWPKG